MNITNGVINQFHQFCREQSTYRRDLELLQYDVLYGKKYLYDGQMPYEPPRCSWGCHPLRSSGCSNWAESGMSAEGIFPILPCDVRQPAAGYRLPVAQLLKITEDPETENAKDLSIRVVDKHNEILTDTAEQRAS